MKPEEIIEIVQAFKDGKAIEYRKEKYSKNWLRLNFCQFDIVGLEYRIKPTPREFYVNIYKGYSVTHFNKKAADLHSSPSVSEMIKVVEVISDE